MKPTKTWVLIANSRQARILERVGLKNDAHTIASCKAAADLQEGHDTTRDRPGRVFESHGTSRHAIEPHQEAKQQEQRIFAKKLAGLLHLYTSKFRFDRLVIVASHSMLGHLRKELASPAKSKISAEIDKDITHLSDEGITIFLHDNVA